MRKGKRGNQKHESMIKVTWQIQHLKLCHGPGIYKL